MRKIISILFVSALALVATSCGGNKGQNQTEGGDAQAVAQGDGIQLTVDTAQSVIEWKGFKVGGTHHGTLKLKSGEVTVKDSTLQAGSFIVDMNTLVDLDQTVAATNKMLVDHLKSADFFDVASFPEAKFEVTSSEAVSGNDSINYKISGNLTMKGVDKNVTFGAKVEKNGEVYTAETVPFTINRTQWGVNFGSKSVFADLKEKIVDDNIELKIKIVAKVAQ